MTRYLALSNYVAYCMNAGMTREETLAEVEAQYVRTVIRRCNGFQSRTAEALGVHRNTAWRLQEKYAPDIPKTGRKKPASQVA